MTNYLNIQHQQSPWIYLYICCVVCKHQVIDFSIDLQERSKSQLQYYHINRTAHLTVQISSELRTEKCSDQECGGPEQLTLQYRFHMNYVQRSAVIKSVGVLTVTPAASGVTRGTARLGLRPTSHIWLYGKWLNAEFPSFMRQIRVTERTPEASQISCTQLWSKTIGLFSYDN